MFILIRSTFSMTVSNQHKRHQSMALGNIVSEDPEVKELTIEQLKEKVEKEDPGLMQKLRYYSKTLEVM